MTHITLECVPETDSLLVRVQDNPPVPFDFQWQALPQFRQMLVWGREDPQTARQLGEGLREALLPAGWEQAELELEKALEQGAVCTLRVQAETASFFALPWELMRLGGSGPRLGNIPRLLVRYVRRSEAASPDDAEAPEAPQDGALARQLVKPLPQPSGQQNAEGGRILFAFADFEPGVPHPHHQAAVARACAAAKLELSPDDVLARLSRKRLSAALRKQPTPAVLHILCQAHRQAGPSEGFGLRWHPDGDEEEAIVGSAGLASLLAPVASCLQLVVLSAVSRKDHELNQTMADFGAALRAVGVKAVLSHRFPMVPSDTIVVAENLYLQLLEKLRPLQTAVRHVRERLVEHSAALGWAALQYFGPQRDLRPIEFRPFRGLLHFSEDYERFYFGRQAERHELLWRTIEAAESKRPGFQILVGASGTGKTSLVQAGLLPQLRNEGGSQRRWQLHRLRPDSPGLHALTIFLRQWQPEPTLRALLVVDPLEQLFSAWNTEAECENFLDVLWQVSEMQGVTVLAVLRADHASRFADLPGSGGRRPDLASLVYTSHSHRMWLAPMVKHELREIIEAPAQLVGLELDEDAIELLTSEAASRSWGLPLLQLALDQLWRARWKSKLEPDFSDPLEAPLRALVSRALGEIQGSALRQTARRLLLALVDTRPDALPFTGRARSVERLRNELGAALDPVLEHLGELGLLYRSGSTRPRVELAHDVLLRFWPELGTWVRQERAFWDQLARLRQQAAQWQHAESDSAEGALLRGNQLGYARYLQSRSDSPFPSEVTALLEASEKAASPEQVGWRDALCMRAYYLLRESDPLHAAQFLAEVRAPEKIEEWRQAAINLLLRGTQEGRKQGSSGPTLRLWFADGQQHPLYLHHMSRVRIAQFSPDGQRVLTVSLDGAAEIWNTDGSGHNQALGGPGGLPFGRSGYFCSLAQFSPAGEHILTAAPDGTARLWSLSDHGEPQLLRGHRRLISTASFSPDGRHIATASYDGTARLWNVAEPGQGRAFQTGRDPLISVEFSPDGTLLATASQSGKVRLWAGDGYGELRLLEHPDKLLFAGFSPDGSQLLTACFDGAARVWPVDGGEPRILREGEAKLWAAQLSPDGQSLATACDDGIARVWSLRDETPARRFEGHHGPLWSAEFSPDGKQLVTASDDRSARIWPLDGGEPLLLRHREEVLIAHFSPQGDTVLTVSGDAAVLWRISTASLHAFLKQMRTRLSADLRRRFLNE